LCTASHRLPGDILALRTAEHQDGIVGRALDFPIEGQQVSPIGLRQINKNGRDAVFRGVVQSLEPGRAASDPFNGKGTIGGLGWEFLGQGGLGGLVLQKK
jgi:hypothetical protein